MGHILCSNPPMSAPGHPFSTIALVGRYGSPGIAEPLRALAAFLASRGHRVLLDTETAECTPLPGYPAVPIAQLGSEARLAIVVGGDGTMLSIARRLAPYGVPLIGVNQGRLGFLTDIALADMENALSAMLSGAYVEETRTLLEADLARIAGGGEHALAFNDVVVNRGSLGSMIDCGDHRRTLRLCDARRRPHRRHSHGIDRLRPFGAGADRLSGGRGDPACAGRAARIYQPADRGEGFRGDRDPAAAGQGRRPALRRPGGLLAGRGGSRRHPPLRASGAAASSQ